MRRSEIFDEFVKIAEENGMISSDKSFDKLEKNPRADSLSVSDIEKLYNVKPDSKLKYKNNIMESAHPESSIASSAYDKLNGLVENNIERQNILLNIVNKNNNGHLTQHKYAKKELLLSLVKIANDLDNKDQEELRSLADACIEQIVNKNLKKDAFWLPAIGWTAATLGAIWTQQHIDSFDQGFRENHRKLVAEIDDLLSQNTNFLVGLELDEGFKQTMSSLKNNLEEINKLYEESIPYVNTLVRPITISDYMQTSQTELKKSDDVVKNLKEKLKDLNDNILPMFKEIKNEFKQQVYKDIQVKDKGFLTKMLDKIPGLHGGQGLISDDFDDVVNSLNAYDKSLKQFIDYLNTAESKNNQRKKEMQQAILRKKQKKQESKILDVKFDPNQTQNNTQTEEEKIKNILDGLNL